MRLTEVLAALRRFKLLAVVVFAAFVAFGALGAFLPGPKYEATAILVATPAGKNADFNSVTNVQFVLPALVQQVGTGTFQNNVFRTVRPQIPRGTVSIKATLDQGTGIIRISATSKAGTAVVPVSNAAASQLIAGKLFPTVKLTLLEPAIGVTNANAGLRIPILASAIVLGLLAAVFSALGANALRSGKLDEDDLPGLDIEILGEIPKRRLPDSGLIDIFAGPTRFGQIDLSESFHKLVANLRAAGMLDESSHLAVLSCSSGEGKTTVAAGLSCALALTGSDVIAIDADLRQGRLNEQLGIVNSRRASTADRSGDVTPQRTRLARLRVIGGAPLDQHPTRAITGTLPALLKSASNSVVVVDSPPVLAVAEATLVAHIVSNVILVAEPGRTDRAAFTRVVHDLRRANVRVLGVVLNRFEGAAASRTYGYPAYVETSLLRPAAPAVAPPADTRSVRSQSLRKVDESRRREAAD
jgi:Mrp family chromosome partitioning ATPase/capsular polysaccharide biosynthesis protein